MLDIIVFVATLVISYYGGAITERETGGAVTATIYTDGNVTRIDCSKKNDTIQ